MGALDYFSYEDLDGTRVTVADSVEPPGALITLTDLDALSNPLTAFVPFDQVNELCAALERTRLTHLATKPGGLFDQVAVFRAKGKLSW